MASTSRKLWTESHRANAAYARQRPSEMARCILRWPRKQTGSLAGRPALRRAWGWSRRNRGLYRWAGGRTNLRVNHDTLKRRHEARHCWNETPTFNPAVWWTNETHSQSSTNAVPLSQVVLEHELFENVWCSPYKCSRDSYMFVTFGSKKVI